MNHWDSSSETVGYLACTRCDHRFFRKSVYLSFDHQMCPACGFSQPRVIKRDVTKDSQSLHLSCVLFDPVAPDQPNQ